jgi:hypothetical protein
LVAGDFLVELYKAKENKNPSRKLLSTSEIFIYANNKREKAIFIKVFFIYARPRFYLLYSNHVKMILITTIFAKN